MAIKDLAVSYNGSSNAKAALQFAIQMAKKYNATLTGLFVATPVRFEGHVKRWISDDVMESLESAQGEIGKSMEESFREGISAGGFEGPVDWIAGTGQPNELLARFARYFDILLMGQLSEAGQDKRHIRAEDLVTRAGGPMIIVPSGYHVRPFREYAVVAWDGSRVAARALTDAMHILETKKRLDVVTVTASDEDKQKGDGTAGLDIIRHLERHGIDARRVSLVATREGVGQTMLDYCKDNDPDVLVMGAYGHARLREDLFGGVTRHVLQHTEVPLLMGH
ncbi:MAG: universal stress protein [Alphaproteobacteria bacterium]|nr:universal stress protein [Alphaproteobacteria bacterium]